MEEIIKYIESLEHNQKDKVENIIDYIVNNYDDLDISMNYAPKTKFPTFKKNGTYISVAGMKHHISIHFGKYGCVDVVTKNNPKVIGRVGYVNIKNNLDFPYDDVYKAIDQCFKQSVLV